MLGSIYCLIVDLRNGQTLILFGIRCVSSLNIHAQTQSLNLFIAHFIVISVELEYILAIVMVKI